MKKIIHFTLISFFCITSAKAQFPASDFLPLHALHGKWTMQTKKGFLVEQWVTVNDSLLQSRSFKVNGTDTVVLESVQLRMNNGSITYNPIVPHQNEGQPVRFTLTGIQNGHYIFENKKHDFPQRIIYQLTTNGLLVTIDGITATGFKEVPYRFVKE